MKKGYKYFFSPQPTLEKKNEFIDNFFNTLAKKVNVINHGKKPSSRSGDFLKYMFSADVMVLNWPEDILHLRFGILQLFTSFITLTFFKLKGGKILWVCHNKDSHKKRFRRLRKMTRLFYTKFSDYIIVLSSDALNYFVKEKSKTYFVNHPVYPNPPLLTEDKFSIQYDVLIWGRISPYKGLNEFIESYRLHKNSFKLKIIGDANKDYFEIITKNASGLNIEITNKFISNDELEHYFKNSKIVLLPYADTDTFSSGALIHSLSSNKIVIGPMVGNFIDVYKKEACLVYENFANLFNMINCLLDDQSYYGLQLTKLRQGISNYYMENSWDNFIHDILQITGEGGKTTETPEKIENAIPIKSSN